MPTSNNYMLIHEILKQMLLADRPMVLQQCLGGIKQYSFTGEFQELTILSLLTNRIGTPILPELFRQTRNIFRPYGIR